MTKIIADYPAYTIVEDKDREYTDGDEIAVPYKSARYGTLYNFYKLGSVEEYARRYSKYSRDIEAAIAHAKQHGHALYYANALPTSITVWGKGKKTMPAFSHGDVIKAFGKKFKIVPAPNQNIRLQEVE
jgi:hypothetical protein